VPYKSLLLQSLQSNLRIRHMSRRTEEAYVYWTRRYVRFCGLRHPGDLGDADVRRFLEHLVRDRGLAAATQQQALSALVFLYRYVIGRPLEASGRLPRGRAPSTLPVVLTVAEVGRVLGLLRGTHHLVGLLLYGGGLRLIECLSLRVKDVDLERRELLIRRAKAGKDRVTLIPEAARRPLRDQLSQAKQLHERDLAHGAGWVELPGGLGAKYPAAGKSWP
jgi:integrase